MSVATNAGTVVRQVQAAAGGWLKARHAQQCQASADTDLSAISRQDTTLRAPMRMALTGVKAQPVELLRVALPLLDRLDPQVQIDRRPDTLVCGSEKCSWI